MRKLVIALIAGIIAVSGLAISVAPAEAAVKNSRNCMTLKEWRKIKDNDTMSRARVAQIVGNRGKKDGPTTYNSDGTVYFSVDFRKCGRPSYDYTWLSFSTEVKYGKSVWDPEKTYHQGHCVGGWSYGYYDSCDSYSEDYYTGGYTWDEYAENGVTRTPRVSYKGSF
jgi:hypothetical protein